MSIHPPTDLGANVKAAFACGCQTTTASGVPAVAVAADGTIDGVKQTGVGIDRTGYLSCVVAVAWSAQLTSTKTLTVAVEYQLSDDDSTYATAVAMQAATLVATGSATTEFTGVVDLDLKLLPFGQYIRFNVTLELSAASADISGFAATCLLGGADDEPAA